MDDSAGAAGEAGRSAGGGTAEGGASADAGEAGRGDALSAAGESAGGMNEVGKGGSVAVAGDAGERATGGAVDDGGASGATAEGGTAGAAGAGAAGTAGAAGSASEPATVAILLDGSSSMFYPRELLWDAIHGAIMDPESGVVPSFASEVRFGFNVFRGDTMPHEESDSACANITSVDFALNNETAIAAAYDAATAAFSVGIRWETPTGHALRRVTSQLTDLSVPDGSRKYIVLITDGNPNTCLTLDPQCGQDLVVKAAQDAYDLGIRTLVFGTGDVLSPNGGCEPASMPCGMVHLQDVANAGVGLPVADPPPHFHLHPCVVGGVLTAEYATVGGTATFYTGSTVDEMRASISSMIQRIVAGDVP